MVDQRRFENQPSQFLEAKPAAKLLGVELRTLYAYASRGLVRSVRGAWGEVHEEWTIRRNRLRLADIRDGVVGE